MARVFDESTGSDWFHYKESYGQAGMYLEELKNIEAWGFLYRYKHQIHPSLLT